MRHVTPAWKVLLALLAILLTGMIWAKGLEDSFDRPSVAPKLSLQQQEMALLADAAVPSPLRPLLVGSDPKSILREALRAIPLEQLNDRQRILLAALEPSGPGREAVLAIPLKESSLLQVQRSLLSALEEGSTPQLDLGELPIVNGDPLINQLGCFAVGGDVDHCVDLKVARNMTLRLFFSQALPAIALLIGSGLLIGQIWIVLKGKGLLWPAVLALPLSLIDMVLLVAGGFVVLGEVIFPMLIAPISTALTRELVSPLGDSLRVVIGYSAMTLAPLLILRQQIQGIEGIDRPVGGWLQWGLRPFNTAFAQALRGWLMVMPLVLLTGWLMNLLVGDQGGSNPLLELVLRSQDPLALILLVITTVVLAPLFEEVIFRGALLPVLVESLGKSWGVIASAVVFALAHLSVGEFPPLMVLGLGLGLLRLSSGRLFPCVAMHALWNGVTFINLLLLGG